MGRALGRCAVLAMVLGALLHGAATRVEAQDASASEDDEYALRIALEEAHYLRGVGMGLTLGGLITTGGGTAGMFTGSWGGAIAGGTFTGLGGVVGLAGIPMWIPTGELVRRPRTGAGPARVR